MRVTHMQTLIFGELGVWHTQRKADAPPHMHDKVGLEASAVMIAFSDTSCMRACIVARPLNAPMPPSEHLPKEIGF